MGAYINAVTAEYKKGWWNALVITVFTLARFVVGWNWFHAGIEKWSWLSDGKFDAGGLLQGLVANIKGSHGPDPLHLNNLLVWVVNHIFMNAGGLVDVLVVFCEILVGVCIFFGFGFIWAIIVAIFLNLQYSAAGAANNFGYLVTDIVWFKFPSQASLIGIDGYLRYRSGKKLVGGNGFSTPVANKSSGAAPM